MDKLLRTIAQYPNGTIMIIEWKNKLKLKIKTDIIFESDNDLEMDDPSYEEFYSCVVEILQILDRGLEKLNFEEGDLIEINKQNAPSKIILETGEVIWENELSD
jgi:hypothetical protein